MSTSVLKVGVAGLGTVGAGLLAIAARGGLGQDRLQIAAVSARSRSRQRGVDISGYAFVDDPVEMARDPAIAVFVELIGGSDGPAKKAVQVALERGAHVVTANKALIAEHGLELAAIAEKSGASLLFEAAVAGGVPIVKVMKESLAASEVQSVSGILNGTCNYLLTEMEASGRAFEDVLADAQRLGYAEADPTMDVGGFDAAHKIAILAAIAFRTQPDYGGVAIRGVDLVRLVDIQLAAKLGYRIKLIAKAERLGGAVSVTVGPALVGHDHPLAGVGGPLNAVTVLADPVGALTFQGRGAGSGPTANAVAADLIDIANGRKGPAFGVPVAALKPPVRLTLDEPRRFYVRLLVHDRPGVIAAVSDRLGRAQVSIDSILQMPVGPGPLVPIVLTTQPCPKAALEDACVAIGALDAVSETPCVLPIEDGNR
ncbi:MAG: homoserine dehydrogenase [Caulobacterales bacterium]|jgi:homoserine dehydrogenase